MPEAYLLASWSRVAAGVLIRVLVFVRVASSGFAYDPDQDGDGDDRDDYQDEQRNYGYGQGSSSPQGCRGRWVCSPDGLNTTLRGLSVYSATGSETRPVRRSRRSWRSCPDPR